MSNIWLYVIPIAVLLLFGLNLLYESVREHLEETRNERRLSRNLKKYIRDGR